MSIFPLRDVVWAFAAPWVFSFAWCVSARRSDTLGMKRGSFMERKLPERGAIRIDQREVKHGFGQRDMAHAFRSISEQGIPPLAQKDRPFVRFVRKLLGNFVPDRLANSLADIDIEELVREGVRGVLVDLDNTLLPWNSSDIPVAHRSWLGAARARGLSVCVISNNHTTRVESALRELGIPYVSSARKPLRVGFVRALRRIGLSPEECVVVGDQLLTDVWGAHRMGMRAVFVRPVVPTDGLHTRVNRFFERRIRRLLERLGLWPEKG